jgi:hypothetical protein
MRTKLLTGLLIAAMVSTGTVPVRASEANQEQGAAAAEMRESLTRDLTGDTDSTEGSPAETQPEEEAEKQETEERAEAAAGAPEKQKERDQQSAEAENSELSRTEEKSVKDPQAEGKTEKEPRTEEKSAKELQEKEDTEKDPQTEEKTEKDLQTEEKTEKDLREEEKTEKDLQTEEKEAEGKPRRKSKAAAAQNSDASSVGMKHGGYIFSWSGGSGRAIITCTAVRTEGSAAYATITFSRPDGSASSYDSVRTGDRTYTGSSTFTIPIRLNGNTVISARTTAMSVPHWISYTLYVGETAEGEEGSVRNAGTERIRSSSENAMDDEAPEIIGLSEAKGETVTKHAQLLRIFTYQNGISLIEIQTGKKADDAAGTSLETRIAALYQKKIVKYLIVPRETEIPAGLENEAIVIRKPQENVFAASASALRLIDEIGAAGAIKAVGLSEDEIHSKSVLEGLKKQDGDTGQVVQAGTYQSWDWKQLILLETTLAVEDSAILREDQEEALTKLTEHAAQMDLAIFFDRSDDEKDQKGQKEWKIAYELLLGEEAES